MTVVVEGVFVALGANLGEPAEQVRGAMDNLETVDGLTLVRRSSLYTSSPMGPTDQPDYVNAVCELSSALEPLALLDQLQRLEQEAGRVRKGTSEKRWGARRLDLDLVLFGQQIINHERLTVPHAGLLKRSFVLVPLIEIAPEIVVPERGLARGYLEDAEDFNLIRLVDA